MARKLKSDRVLFIATILLVALSVVMVYSASAPVGVQVFGRSSLFLIKQGMWAVLGIAMLNILMRIDYRAYKQPAFLWTALGFVVFALVAVYFRAPVNGARRWFGVGGIGVQPSELAKLVAIFFIAALLERRMHRIDDVAYALPALYVVVMGSAYRRRRTLAFLNPWDDPLGDGFQIIQSLIAVGTGGVWGRGLMNGVQKLFYLPEPHTDFIYAAIAEELGLIGATAVVICFCLVAWRGMRIALRAPDSFGAFIALGLTTMVAVQAFLNISVVLGLLPTKGTPLPFVSFGGSSLLINLIGMGILLNVSQHVPPET